jgi:hypothetical protein
MTTAKLLGTLTAFEVSSWDEGERKPDEGRNKLMSIQEAIETG